MKRKTLGIAVAVVLGTLSASAFAITPFGNNSNKGSILIYSRIDVRGGNDTYVTMTNDSTVPVLVKCYYATSDRIATPNSSSAAALRPTKHFLDFTINLTHNQPVSWRASDGTALGNSTKWGGQVVPPFGQWPDGATNDAGELKCWAIDDSGTVELIHNHLFGTASIYTANQQAWEYTATAFQALAPSTQTGQALGTPGQLFLDNVEYDACPNILLGNFHPTGNSRPQTQVTLASCNEDLRQAYTPTITKLTWTFWNQDEAARTNTHFCADSWFETDFPVGATPSWFASSYTSLGTEAAYFRIETTADTQICGPSAVTSAYVGVIRESDSSGQHVRGTNLVGRGVANGLIKYDVGLGDSFKR